MEELIDEVKKFCEDRDWDQFHSPKDLAIGLVTEASELLDIFRFQSDKQCQEFFLDSTYRESIEDEVSDVLFFLLRFAERNNIDLVSACRSKMKKSGLKYPVEKYRGNNKKYNK